MKAPSDGSCLLTSSMWDSGKHCNTIRKHQDHRIAHMDPDSIIARNEFKSNFLAHLKYLRFRAPATIPMAEVISRVYSTRVQGRLPYWEATDMDNVSRASSHVDVRHDTIMYLPQSGAESR